MSFWKFGKKSVSNNIIAPQDGEIMKIEDLNDGVFSEKLLGDGFFVRPISGTVYSPVNGVINQIADTLHAFGITTDDGLDILVHIGLDTVKLRGDGFRVPVRNGQKVAVGDVLAYVDLELLSKENYQTDTIVLITNAEKVASFETNCGKCIGGESVGGVYVLK